MTYDIQCGQASSVEIDFGKFDSFSLENCLIPVSGDLIVRGDLPLLSHVVTCQSTADAHQVHTSRISNPRLRLRECPPAGDGGDTLLGLNVSSNAMSW